MRRIPSMYISSLVLALPLLLTVSCARQTTGPVTPEGEATFLFQTNVSSTTISTVEVVVTAADISPPLVFNLPVSNGTASGTLLIPTGLNRTITVRALDLKGIVTHHGNATVNVVEGMNPALNVTLQSGIGQQPVHVTFGRFMVVVEPAVTTMALGATTQLTAVVTNADGDTMSVPVRWATSNPAFATVDAEGLVTGVKKGATEIVATFGGVRGSSWIIVGAEVEEVVVDPDEASLVVGETVQLTATVIMTGGIILSTPVTWDASDPATASVDAEGFVTAVSAGTASITASYGGVSGSSDITVEPGIDQVIVDPDQVSMPDHETVQLSATVLDTEGEILPVLVTWSTSNPAVATVDHWGLVTSVSDGTADITASYQGVEGSAAITVEPIPPTPPFAYVTDHEAHTITVIDALFRVVATIELDEGSFPRGIAITPDGAYAYVGEYGLADVVVIEIATNTVVATIPVGNRPTGVGISPDGSHVYVANFDDDTVSVIETDGNTVTATVNVYDKPLGLDVSPDGAHVYVANWASGRVSVIETTSNTMVSIINTTGSMPYDVAFTPSGAYAFVPCFGGFGSVFVINTVTRSPVRRIDIGSGPINIAMTPVGDLAYVTKQNEDEVSVIDTIDWYEVTSIPVGDAPYGVAITSDGAYAYVANLFDDTVSVIDTASNEVVATVNVGIHPHDIAITP
ncbi:Ig-like domain-containing protein [Gemmatimonadota bacterium]